MRLVTLHAQSSLSVKVKSEDNQQPLPGASVFILPLGKGGATDSSGTFTFTGLAAGKYQIKVSYVGFNTKEVRIEIPFTAAYLQVNLDANEKDDTDSAVVVTATRSDRTINNTPTRVEVIARGEISENISMRPGEIRMLLNETTGVMTQPTSAVSGTAELRIQELDGRYTQLLKDGLPLYSGLSEGLSLIQIPPLDLRQVEIIKGPSSTLFGGGAITGLVNLVSKTPEEKRELSFLLNGTSAGGLDVSGFYSEKYQKLGITIFSSYNHNNAYDPFSTGLTAIPRFDRYTIAPKLFIYAKNTLINLGVTYQNENRLGGSMNYIHNGSMGYYERNISRRITTQLQIKHHLADESTLTLKSSLDHFHRDLQLSNYRFDGIEPVSFSELSWQKSSTATSWVAGINYYTNHFNEIAHQTDTLRNFNFNTIGAFVQNTWVPTQWFSVESGIRSDYTAPFGWAVLPKISFLIRYSPQLTSRIGGGLGYKLPSIFTEESELLHYQGVLPINIHETNYERSIGGTFDVNYTAHIDDVKLSFNPLFFYTRIHQPLVLTSVAGGKSYFRNENGYTDSRGLDMSFRFTLDGFSFYTGYTYTIARNHFNQLITKYLLAPHDRLHFDLVYEKENKIRFALESYYTSSQQLSDGTSGQSYWLIGALIEKSWKHFSIFINGEDLNNAHQSAWAPVYNGSIANPQFKDVYAPLEGRTINAGIKVKL